MTSYYREQVNESFYDFEEVVTYLDNAAGLLEAAMDRLERAGFPKSTLDRKVVGKITTIQRTSTAVGLFLEDISDFADTV